MSEARGRTLFKVFSASAEDPAHAAHVLETKLNKWTSSLPEGTAVRRTQFTSYQTQQAEWGERRCVLHALVNYTDGGGTKESKDCPVCGAPPGKKCRVDDMGHHLSR